MELVQEYYKLWKERLKYDKASWIEGCQELISDSQVKNRLRYAAVPGTLNIYHGGRAQVEGADFIVLEDQYIQFLNHKNIRLPALIEYTGYEIEDDDPWN